MVKHICFCIHDYNNYTTKHLKTWFEKTKNVTYLVIGKELTKKDGPHIQGYMQVARIPEWAKLTKNIFGPDSKLKPHYDEACKWSSAEQCAGYCLKGLEPSRKGQTPGNEFYYETPSDTWKGFQVGELQPKITQGCRTDLKKYCKMIEDGEMKCSDFQTAEYATVWHQYGRTLRDVETQALKKRCNKFTKMTVTVLVGDAGEGKTRYAYDKHGYENCFKIDSEASQQFLCDGYDGEDVLIIDDFKGWIKYTTMLDYLEGHPVKLNVKGGHTYKRWSHVYITSNVSPALWYKKPLGKNMRRRFTNGVHIIENSKIVRTYSLEDVATLKKEYDSYEDDDYDIV